MASIDLNLTMALHELKIANDIVKSKHSYDCGLTGKERYFKGYIYLFFESPNYQNEELFYLLRMNGWRSAGFAAPYHWNVKKQGVFISYSEGDISIYNK